MRSWSAGWFDDPIVEQELMNLAPDPILVHFDADLKRINISSTCYGGNILKEQAETNLFLFDD